MSNQKFLILMGLSILILMKISFLVLVKAAQTSGFGLIEFIGDCVYFQIICF